MHFLFFTCFAESVKRSSDSKAPFKRQHHVTPHHLQLSLFNPPLRLFMLSVEAFALQSPGGRPSPPEEFQDRSPVPQTKRAADEWWNTQPQPEDTAVTNDIVLRLRINAAKILNSDEHRQFFEAPPAFSHRSSSRDSSRPETPLDSPSNLSQASPSCSPPPLPCSKLELPQHQKPPRMFEWLMRSLKKKPTNREKRTASR